METALKANSRNPHFLNNIGLSHFRLSNFKEAENYFKRGLDEAPKYISIINNLGNLKSYLFRIRIYRLRKNLSFSIISHGKY